MYRGRAISLDKATVRAGIAALEGRGAAAPAGYRAALRGGGVAGAIKRAAGDAVEREAVALGPIDPGESVATSAGALEPPIRYVIHAATMGPDLMTSEALIQQATTSALEVAARVGAKSVG